MIHPVCTPYMKSHAGRVGNGSVKGIPETIIIIYTSVIMI